MPARALCRGESKCASLLRAVFERQPEGCSDEAEEESLKHCLFPPTGESMKKLVAAFLTLFCVALVVFSSSPARAQTGAGSRMTFTGTIVGIGGTLGGRARQFTLDITGTTPDQDGTRY